MTKRNPNRIPQIITGVAVVAILLLLFAIAGGQDKEGEERAHDTTVPTKPAPAPKPKPQDTTPTLAGGAAVAFDARMKSLVPLIERYEAHPSVAMAERIGAVSPVLEEYSLATGEVKGINRQLAQEILDHYGGS